MFTGWESGILKDGSTWPYEGAFDGSSVMSFVFCGKLISLIHVYVGPDFGLSYAWRVPEPGEELSLRDRAIVLFIGSTGLRRSEMIALTWSDPHVVVPSLE